MQKTTSIIQNFAIDNYTSSDSALIVRPPANIRAFRVSIIVTNQLAVGRPAAVYISNFSGANVLSSILLSNFTSSETSTNVPPSTDNTNTYLSSTNKIILDRRGVGYMADTFYIWNAFSPLNTATVCFIWEGEID